jgi:hypothetical protein
MLAPHGMDKIHHASSVILSRFRFTASTRHMFMVMGALATIKSNGESLQRGANTPRVLDGYPFPPADKPHSPAMEHSRVQVAFPNEFLNTIPPPIRAIVWPFFGYVSSIAHHLFGNMHK